MKYIPVALHITGIECDGCVRRIEHILANMVNIKTYYVNLQEKQAILEITSEEEIDKIWKKIETLGFGVSNITYLDKLS